MSKVLVIGSRGQLGSDLLDALGDKHEVIGINRPELDITNRLQCQEVLHYIRPDIVANTAAFHNTIECQRNPHLAFEVNAEGAFNVASEARAIGAISMFFSTDYVFDGSKIQFTEGDKPNPLNVYGVSKLAGELLTKVGNPESYGVRTSWLYGLSEAKSSKGPNFVRRILSNARNGEALQVVNDQIGSPTYTKDLAMKVSELINSRAEFGIYHLSNTGFCSWYDFAREIVQLAGIEAEVTPINSRERESMMVRPERSVLVSNKLENKGISPMRHWQEALNEYMITIASEYV